MGPHRRLRTPSDTFANFHRFIHMSNQGVLHLYCVFYIVSNVLGSMVKKYENKEKHKIYVKILLREKTTS